MTVRFYAGQLFYHGTDNRHFAEGHINPTGEFYLSTTGFASPITANTRYKIKYRLVRNINAGESRNIKRGDVDQGELLRNGGLLCSVPDAPEPQVIAHWETVGDAFEYVSWSFCWWSDSIRWLTCRDQPARYEPLGDNDMV